MVNINIPFLLDHIKKLKLPLEQEKQTQQQLYTEMQKITSDFHREYRFNDKNIIDFFFPSLQFGIEIKIGNASRKDIYRQIERYCTFDNLQEVLLLTNKSIGLPQISNSKKIHIINLGKAWL